MSLSLIHVIKAVKLSRTLVDLKVGSNTVISGQSKFMSIDTTLEQDKTCTRGGVPARIFESARHSGATDVDLPFGCSTVKVPDARIMPGP